MAKKDDAQETLPGTDSKNAKDGNGTKPPAPVTLKSAHDFALATTALEHRAEELKKLSKKNSEEGYVREARAIEADAAAIEHAILPQFRSQRELPLADFERLEKSVGEAIATFVRRAFVSLDDPKVAIGAREIGNRRDNLLRVLSSRIALYAQEVARESYEHGLAARALTPEGLAGKSIATLRGSSEN